MLNDRKTLMSAGVAGLAFVVLVLTGAFIAGAGPDPDASASEVREFLADNRTALLWGVLIGLLGTVPAVWFVGVLAQSMRRATGDWVLSVILVIGVVLVAAMAWGANAVVGAVVWSDGFIGTVSDELVLYGWNASFMMYAASSVGFTVFLGAAAWAVLRTRLMPAPVGWLAAVGAVLAAISTLATLDAEMGMLAFFGFLAFALWIVVASIVMIAGKVRLPESLPPPSRPIV